MRPDGGHTAPHTEILCCSYCTVFLYEAQILDGSYASAPMRLKDYSFNADMYLLLLHIYSTSISITAAENPLLHPHLHTN